MKSLPEVVLLTADDGLACVLQAIVEPVACVNRFDVEAAVTGLRHATFDAALIDAKVPGRMASVLARLYLYHDPTGRLAVIGGNPDSSTVLGMAACDARVEVFFNPLDTAVIREWAFAAVAAAMGTTV